MNMERIKREEVLPPEEYLGKRSEINRKIIEIERSRRISTKTFSFLFENREIALNQINEMVFLENIKDEEEIGKLINIYSEQIPEKNELSISLFIEFSDQSQLTTELPKLAGIEKNIFLTFDRGELKGIPEEGRSTEVLESTLQYLKFRFTEQEAEKFRDAKNVYIESRHKGYEETARIPQDLLKNLKDELISA